jgi:subtilisin
MAKTKTRTKAKANKAKKSGKRRSAPAPRRRPSARAVPRAAMAAAAAQQPLVREVPQTRGTAVAVDTSPIAASGAAVMTATVTVAAPIRRRMILLPARGLRADTANVAAALVTLNNVRNQGVVRLSNVLSGPALTAAGATVGLAPMPATGNASVRVIDSIAENGAKLIEVSPEDEGALRASLPGVRLVPETFYEPLSLRLALESALIPAAQVVTVRVTVRSATTNAPVRDVKVIGFTNFAQRLGAEGTTNAAGIAILQFATPPGTLERLYAFPDTGFWGSLRTAVPTSGGVTMRLAPIDLAAPDFLRRVYGEPPLPAGAGVPVGVLDTGCGPHPNLVIAGGFNAVTGENPGDFGDNGDRHGSHVAGIIAARGAAPTGVRGVAPGATLRSYRVFAKGKNASNFDIAKAIDRAASDRCDLLNMSLGRPANSAGGAGEPAVRAAIEDARAAGSVVLAASGNDGRAGVSFPAADDLCVAVSAVGHRLSLVANSTSSAAFAPPTGTDPNEFIADFSNIGPQVDLCGPGVGIVSTVVPGNSFAVMDGTSMACPAATGAAARILAASPLILNATRDATRSAAIVQLLLQRAATRGFQPIFEGHGMLP